MRAKIVSLKKTIDKVARRVYQDILKEALEDKVLNSVFEEIIIKKLLMYNYGKFNSYIKCTDISNKKIILSLLIKYRNKNCTKEITSMFELEDKYISELESVKDYDVLEYFIEHIYMIAKDEINNNIIEELFNTDKLKKVTNYNILQEMRKAQTKGDVFVYREELISILKENYKHNIDKIRQSISKLSEENIIYEDDDRIYFTEYYEAEHTLALNIKQRLNTVIQIEEQIKDKIDRYIEKENNTNTYKFSDEQREAIYNVFNSNISLIIGSAGTGKSTLIGNITRCIKYVYSDTVKIGLVSFTGKAVTRLNAEEIGITATTIHRFLNLKDNDKKYEVKSVPAVEFLIVDEASMTDLRLMSTLFNSLESNTRIILVGDIFQLEPVGAGAPFLNLFNCNNIAKTELHTIYRQKQNSILLNNANAIRRGDFDSIKYYDEFKIIDCKDDKDILGKVTEQINSLKKDGYALDDIAILAQNNKLVDEINNMISYSVSIDNKIHSKLFNINDKVIQTINNYEKNVFNGEAGKITAIESFADRYIVKVRFDFKDKEVIYTNEEIYQLRLGYAITVHKSQGSEYKAVIIVVDDENIDVYYNKLLYVSATRAKQKAIIISEAKNFKKAVENKSKVRNEYLLERIQS
ncbi:AAA family ATPase [Clostridium sp. ZBS2]|uniref:ATP-dependent DNA helicase n=1 Tax=Clostridium sp. ZBS2 TaxID=2949976 RepID=UPI00207A15C9|nr:AAA family ATPase [Clostridium sp. ZBS2]